MPAETIGRLWTMLAHAQGTLLNQAKLASSLGVSSPAVARYLDLLVDLLLVRRLKPWMGNVGKRLVRTAKVYIRDSGITHALLDIESFEDLLGQESFLVHGGHGTWPEADGVAAIGLVELMRHICKGSVFHSLDPLWCRHVLMKVSISRGPLPRLIIRRAPRHPELRHPDARPDRVWRLDPRRLYVHEFAQLAVHVADVITVQARHIIERRPRLVENGFERRKTFSA